MLFQAICCNFYWCSGRRKYHYKTKRNRTNTKKTADVTNIFYPAFWEKELQNMQVEISRETFFWWRDGLPCPSPTNLIRFITWGIPLIKWGSEKKELKAGLIPILFENLHKEFNCFFCNSLQNPASTFFYRRNIISLYSLILWIFYKQIF